MKQDVSTIIRQKPQNVTDASSGNLSQLAAGSSKNTQPQDTAATPPSKLDPHNKCSYEHILCHPSTNPAAHALHPSGNSSTTAGPIFSTTTNNTTGRTTPPEVPRTTSLKKQIPSSKLRCRGRNRRDFSFRAWGPFELAALRRFGKLFCDFSVRWL